MLFDGVDLVKLSQKELLQKRQSISMIFQGFNLFSQRSVLKNICYPLEIAGVKKEVATKKAQELLELVGLGDKANAYPSQLSGGQKQRVAIARALATDPKVLLCDEATSALDPGTTLQILNLLQEVREKLGVTVIIITHEMEVVQRICDKVAVMNQGQVVETGTTEQIFLNPKSPITRKMLLTEQNTEFIPSNGPIIRISFDGQAASLPLLSKLILESQAPINILKADTEEIKGKAFGQMIVQLPEKEALVEKIKEWVSNDLLNRFTFYFINIDKKTDNYILCRSNGNMIFYYNCSYMTKNNNNSFGIRNGDTMFKEHLIEIGKESVGLTHKQGNVDVGISLYSGYFDDL